MSDDGFVGVMALLCMVMGIIQIIFNQPIAAGCFWIAGAIYKTKEDANCTKSEGDKNGLD